MKNVNTFSYASKLRKHDPRRELFRQQRKERGFDNSELWSLNTTIYAFALPRLKAFKEYTKSYPVALNSMDEWQAILDKMITGLALYIEDTWSEEAKEGTELFHKYFEYLWS